MFYNNGYNQDWSTLKKLVWLRGNPATGQIGTDLTVSGTPPLSLPNSLGKPLKAWSVDLLPYQDLHGYDAPWPAGGGKNLLPNTGNNTTYTGVTVTYNQDDETYTLNGVINSEGNLPLASISNLSWTIGNTYTISCNVVSGSFTLAGESGITYAIAIFNSKSNAYIRGEVNKTESELDGYAGTGTAFTSSGNYSLMLQCWRIGTVFNNLKIRIQLESGSTASEWTPYSNLCPIYGTDKLTITTAGKNLLNKTDFVAETANTTVTTTDTGIKILVTGIGTYRRTINVNVIDYASAAGKTVTLSYHNTNLNGGIARYRIALYKQDGTQKQSLMENAQTTDRDITTTVAVPSNVSEAYSLGIALYANGNDANGASVEYSNLQLEFGSNASDYVPYVAPSQTVLTLPQTVYTGTIGSEGGESRWGEIVFNGTEPWAIGSAGEGFWTAFNSMVKLTDYTNAIICDKLKTYQGNASIYYKQAESGITGYVSSGYPNQNWIYAKVPEATTATEFKAWLAANPITVVYELATPIQFSITASTIPTPTGTATTWATAEDGTVDSMEVTYVGKA